MIPLDTKVLSIITEKRDTYAGEVLIEFAYTGDLDKYIDSYHLLDNDSDEAEAAVYNYNSNKIQITSPGGEISDVRIYINNRNRLDPTVLEIWKHISKDLKARQRLYSIGKTDSRSKMSAIDNLDLSQLKTGTHKYRGIEFEGARIVFYVRKDKQLGHGDKMCNRYGGKGIVTKVLDSEETPRGEFSGDIEVFMSPISVLGRKNLAVVKELYLGKIFYNLPTILAKKGADSRVNPQNLRKLVLSIYEQLDNSPNQKYFNIVKTNLNKIPDTRIKKVFENKEFTLNIIIEPFVNISMENIKNVADLLNIPLDEHVYIPTLKTWTKTKVPVGIQYLHSMEQVAEDYESLRSTGGYRSVTGQPQKGRVNMGGQSVGNWDIYSLLAYDIPQCLEELMTVRSDDFKSKRKVTIDILENGEASLPTETGNATTRQLYEIHMIGMGLNPS